MRSLTLRILFCLALGLLTTVAIAWACAAFVPLSTQAPVERQFVDADGELVWQLAQRGFGRSRINYVRGPNAQYAQYENEFPGLVVPLLDAFAILRPDNAGSEERAGWPLASLVCRSNQLALSSDTMSFTISMNETILEGGILLSPSAGSQPWRALPCQPIWIGLVLDAVIFGCGGMTLLFGIAPLRAQVRRWRGRCPKCGYDLRGQLQGGCPECGWKRDVTRDP